MFNEHARWIWIGSDTAVVNQYVCFRKEFLLARKPERAMLTISADSDYQLFVNGAEIYGRQFSDYPQARSYDTYAVAPLLRRGRNCIAVLGYYRGIDASEYRKGRPGLIAALEAGSKSIVSDRSWVCRLSPSFKSGPMPVVTKQMGITVEFDARREDAWQALSYRPGRGWRPAVELAGPVDGYWQKLSPRPLPQMRRKPFQAGRIVCVGMVRRPPNADPAVPALAMTADFKRMGRTLPGQEQRFTFEPPRGRNEGAAAIVDLGAESFGMLRVEIEAPAGTLVDVAHGEHLEDLGVRAAPHDRRFADRFICKKGRNVFVLPFRRLGCRFLELHILNFRRRVTLHAAGLYPLEYPVREPGSFKSADTMLSEVRAVAVKTLKLCMGDHYFDCPWREQSLYSYDSRNQALYGYYAFGEYDFPEESFRLLGNGTRGDGLLEMCAPAGVPITIPVFSLAWICAVQEHWLFSGRDKLFREFQSVIESILRAFLARRDAATGLYNIFDGKEYWTFYEWINGLDHKPEPLSGPGGKFRLDSPHNLYLVEALRAYATMLEWAGRMSDARKWQALVDGLATAIRHVFWDDRRGLMASYADRQRKWHYAAGVQALALCNGIVPLTRHRAVQERMLNDASIVPMTLQVLGYGCRAMVRAAPPLQAGILGHVRKTFGAMLMQGATSLWEIDKIYHDAFAIAGSMCHGWSSVPVWLTQAYILGIRPLTPGFKTFAVTPHTCGLPGAAGVVPTPLGDIAVRWEQGRAGAWLDIRAPRGLKPVVRPAGGFARPLRVRER